MLGTLILSSRQQRESNLFRRIGSSHPTTYVTTSSPPSVKARVLSSLLPNPLPSLIYVKAYCNRCLGACVACRGSARQQVLYCFLREAETGLRLEVYFHKSKEVGDGECLLFLSLSLPLCLSFSLSRSPVGSHEVKKKLLLTYTATCSSR